MLNFLKRIRTESENERFSAVRSKVVTLDDCQRGKLAELGVSSQEDLKIAIYDLIVSWVEFFAYQN